MKKWEVEEDVVEVENIRKDIVEAEDIAEVESTKGDIVENIENKECKYNIFILKRI